MKLVITFLAIMGASAGVLAEKLGPYAGIGVNATYNNQHSEEYNGNWGKGNTQAVSLYGGYRFNQYLAAEIGLSHQKEKYDMLWISVVQDNIDVKGDGLVASLSILPMIPINENLDAYLSLGYSIKAIHYDFYYPGTEEIDPIFDETLNRDAFTLGAGLMWHGTGSLYGKVGVETKTGEEDDVLGINASIGLKF